MTPRFLHDARVRQTAPPTEGRGQYQPRTRRLPMALLLLGALALSPAWAQGVSTQGAGAPSSPGPLASLSLDDEVRLEAALRGLAAGQLAALPPQADPNVRFRLRLVAGHHQGALEDIAALRQQRAASLGAGAHSLFVQHEVWLRAQLRLGEGAPRNPASETAALETAFAEVFSRFGDLQAFEAFGAFRGHLASQRAQVGTALDKAKGEPVPSPETIQALIRSFQVYRVYRDLLPRAEALMAADDQRRYEVKDDVLIRTPQGVTLSATRMHARRPDKRP